MTGGEPIPRRSVVRVGSQLLVFPMQGPEFARCVMANKNGQRCRAPLYFDCGGDVWVIRGVGEVTAHYIGERSEEAALMQICPRHEKQPGTVVAPIDWEIFHPDKHPDLVSPHVYEWTESGLIDRRIDWYKPRPEASAGVATTGTALYRRFDAEGTLLYVGITDALDERTKAHDDGSSWSEFATHETVEMFPDRAAALAAEVQAIRSERPLFNMQHNNSPEARRRLVGYLIQNGRIDLLVPSVKRG